MRQETADRVLRNHHADARAGINRRNVGQLKQAWKIETEGLVSHRPLISGDRAYFADWSGRVYAVNARSGEVIWKKRIQEEIKSRWPWHGFAGTGTLGGGLLFEASAEGTAYAIDPRNGEVVWETEFAQDEHAGSISDLLHYNGMVYVGVSSVEEPLTKMKDNFQPNFQGKVVALDARSGDIAWTGNLATGNHTGAGVWSGFAVDPRMNALFFTTSNNYTSPANGMSDAIVAVDASTGEKIWSTQTTQNDVWTKADPRGPDYAFAAAPQLFEATIDGQRRELVGAGQKSGFFYALDRRSGDWVWTTSIGYGGAGGGIHGEASIAGDRLYLWSNNSYEYGKPADQYPMNVKVLDAATGAYLWVKPRAQPASATGAGFLAGDVYFTPSLDGFIRGYRATNGQKVWTSPELDAISSSLWVDRDTLYATTGVPKKFGGDADGGGAVLAFRPGGQSEQSSENTQQRSSGPQQASGSQQQSDSKQPTGEAQQVNVVAKNLAYAPSRLTAQPGQTLAITLMNRGDAQHSIEFDLPNGEEKLNEKVPPGESKTLRFQAPEKPGEYVFYCPVRNHRRKGMKGILVVQRGGSAER